MGICRAHRRGLQRRRVHPVQRHGHGQWAISVRDLCFREREWNDNVTNGDAISKRYLARVKMGFKIARRIGFLPLRNALNWTKMDADA